MIKRLSLATAVAIALSQSAGATSVDDMFSVRGFGTFGVVHSDTDKADFARESTLQTKGVGYSDKWSMDVDSRSGLQIDMKFNDRFSGVVQLVSEAMHNNTWDGDGNKKYVPSLEWANLSYKVTDDLTVRAGRIVLPLMMTGEYDKVGYASHWMRAPISLQWSTNDGADLTYKVDMGKAINTARVYYGGYTLRGTMQVDGQVSNKGFVDTVEIGALTLHVGYLDLSYQSLEKGLPPAFAALVPAIPSLGNYTGKLKAKMWELGTSYDAGSWFASAEMLRGNWDLEFMPDHQKWYVTGGARVGKFTPFATYAKTSQSSLDLNFAPGVPDAFQDMLTSALSNSTASYIPQEQVSVGVRWDVLNNVDVKAQWDHFMLKDGSTGNFINAQPGFAGSSVNVVGLSVDFVF